MVSPGRGSDTFETVTAGRGPVTTETVSPGRGSDTLLTPLTPWKNHSKYVSVDL